MKKIGFVALTLLFTTLKVNAQSCLFDVDFVSKAQHKTQSLSVTEMVSLELSQYVAKQVVSNAAIVSNVTCQKFIGHQYSGSQEEWAGFVKSALDGLIKAGFTDLQFTRVGTDESIYQGKLDNLQYRISGDIGGNQQIIQNLTLLDKAKNQVYTLSVSGNEKVKSEIEHEFARLVASFKPN